LQLHPLRASARLRGFLRNCRRWRCHVKNLQVAGSDTFAPLIVDLGRHIVPGMVGVISRSGIIQLKQVLCSHHAGVSSC
jgi:hypothetical protein